ncbi:MAG: flagellar hook-basal body complex protein [Deltaproteobacteria bacterium]|jgi:flagellar hook-basal body protein|nr:flagellar hook-basal body complex protein [Deltaproteobacteria bacterium]
MSISSAMYAAVTGLSALSTGMQVISNNIANVNTVGFKAGRTNFEDLISQDYWSNGKIQQIGRGVKVASVQQMFTQGSFMNSAQDTDMAITGEGFFQVRDRVTNELMYTRAGNFTFDAEGVLETPAGYVLQGWELSVPKPGQDPARLGVPTDVKVVVMNAPPVETSQIKVVANLNADDQSAYLYSSAGWAEIYADQVARGPAEAARDAAADLVYNWTNDGSAYPTPTGKAAFDDAYVNWMTDEGFVWSASTGEFFKTVTSYPSAALTASALASAASAGWVALGLPDPVVYPISAAAGTSTKYASAYNSAYVAWMSGLGYTVEVSPTEFRKPSTVDPPSSTELASAVAAGLADAELAGAPNDYVYPSGIYTWDVPYWFAYDGYLTDPARGYTSAAPTGIPVYYVKRPAFVADLADAEQAGSAAAIAAGAASYTTFPSGNATHDGAYMTAYLANMTAQGFAFDPANANLVLATWSPTAADFVLGAVAAGSAAAIASGATSPFTTFPSGNATYDGAYMNAYLANMTASGYAFEAKSTLDPSSAANWDPATDDFVLTASSAVMAAADTAARAAVPGLPSGYVYPSGVSVYDTAYAAAYGAHIMAAGYELPTIPIPLLDSYTKTNPGAAAGQGVHVDAHNDALEKAKAAVSPLSGYPNHSPDPAYQAAYDAKYLDIMTDAGYTDHGGLFVKVDNDVPPDPITEVPKAQAAARAAAEQAAANAGQAAYNLVYEEEFADALASIAGQWDNWQLEGMGFAGAWDGTDLSSPIDPENYTHANPWTIYDSLGTAHTLMVYYQPNPHMENVWDYLITCDPNEDARKDINNRLVMNGATFAGIVQKGKITFTADGADRHGGQIADIEAQNIDMTKTAAAALTSASAFASSLTASSMNYAELGGYFTGQPVFSASTGSLRDNDRVYTITWKGNLGTVPDVSGFAWFDDEGNSGTIAVHDKNYAGPYPFGSGLNVSFGDGGTPMRFTAGDNLTFTAHSEQIAWTNLAPNTEGYFDFDVAFVQSASLSLHPPYPEGMPTITQHIALDMGARNPTGEAGKWILDEQGTTQYASKSINIFSSQDGYPAGSLQRVSIDKDGVLTGVYTNGRHQPLYQIGLARFLNPWGLAKLGDNVYMETRWSGTGTINPPGYGGTGTIRANFLEQSNTDLADEIVNMIVTQRGFQANSKVVTTTDTMLAEVIEMKR